MAGHGTSEGLAVAGLPCLAYRRLPPALGLTPSAAATAAGLALVELLGNPQTLTSTVRCSSREAPDLLVAMASRCALCVHNSPMLITLQFSVDHVTVQQPTFSDSLPIMITATLGL